MVCEAGETRLGRNRMDLTGTTHLGSGLFPHQAFFFRAR